MLKLGEQQTLIIEKTVPMGVYLIEAAGDTEHVLLPRKQVPEGAAAGSRVSVFLYKDSEDRMIATCRQPALTLHQVGLLRVREVGRIGAFLDWGLDKDLLLPFHEQPKERVQKGQDVLAAVYIDKSGRLCATMNVYPYLETDSPYHKGDEVHGTVYQTSDNFGTFVAVDNRYSALISRKELVRDLRIGEKIRARVISVRPDGKLNLAIRNNAATQMEPDAAIIVEALRANGGVLDFTDKADPGLIRDRMHMSKNEFKRAAGHLLKEGRIEIGDDRIRLVGDRNE